MEKPEQDDASAPTPSEAREVELGALEAMLPLEAPPTKATTPEPAPPATSPETTRSAGPPA